MPSSDSSFFSQKDLEVAAAAAAGRRMSHRNSTVMKYVRDHDNVFVSDGSGSLYCKVCEVRVAADKALTVQQHLKTAKHLKLANTAVMQHSASAELHRRNSVSKSFTASRSMQECQPFGGSVDDLVMTTAAASAAAAAPMSAGARDKKSPFARDLCRALVFANIPLAKAADPEFRSFLEKYSLHPMPGECELRKTYLDDCYAECLTWIRRRLAHTKIWAALHETVDAAGDLVGVVVVGALSPDGPGETFLLAAGVLREEDYGGAGGDEECANLAGAKLFDDAMSRLWPDDVHHADVFLFLYAGSARGHKTADCLSAVYAKMVPVACVARELHGVAEHVCADYPAVDQLISAVQRVFSRDPARFAKLRSRAPGVHPPPEPRVPARWTTWIEAARYLSENFAAVRDVLVDRMDPGETAAGPVGQAQRLVRQPTTEPGLAFVDSNYGFLPAKVAQLEARGAPLTRTVAAVAQAAEKLDEVTGDLGTAVHRRFTDALSKNEGFQALVKITDIMAGRSATMAGLPSHMSGNDLKYFKYAPVAMVDVRQTFPRYETVFSEENRRAHGEDSLNKMLVVQCNNFSGK